MTKNIIIGTAGHIDHGKSTLIKALTGDDTDRLAEEKERGISIEAGFSHLENKKTKAENLKLGIVDVPGHEKFVNKMLAAAGGIDLALIVVAADEGVMPQTKEHLAILDLLAVEKAVVVITKIDLVDQEWLQLIEADLKDHLQDTFAEAAKFVRVSSTQNKGINELKDLIIITALNMSKRKQAGVTYFPVDRTFNLKGFGTVVTGTLFSGELKVGEELTLYPAEKSLKIRSLESHGEDVKRVEAGSRVGINTAGIDKSEIRRGDVIAAADSLFKSKFFEGELKLLKNLNFSVKNGDQIHFHTAAFETTGRIYLYNKKEAFPGEKVYIKLILDEEAALFFKQKYIIRRFSPMQTIGGGEILEIDPPPRRKAVQEEIERSLISLKKASNHQAVEILIQQKINSAAGIGFLKKKTTFKKEELKMILDNLAAEEKIIALRADQSYIHQEQFEKIKNCILKIANEYHQEFKLQKGIKKEELRSKLAFELSKKELDSLLGILYNDNFLKENHNLVAKNDFKISLDAQMEKNKNKIIEIYKEKLFCPPTRKEIIADYQLGDDFFDFLVDRGFLIRVSEELYFHQIAVEKAKNILDYYFKDNKNLRLAEFRDLINSSRRYALPLLKKLEELKVVKSSGELRYPAKNLKE